MKSINNLPKIDIVILAGGKGSRIKNYLNNSCKPMINFNGRPFIDYIIKKVSSYPINHIHIMAGYKGNRIYKKYNNKYQNFVPISCYVEKKSMGTGGCLKLIEKKLTKNFILINGDTYFDIDYSFFFNLKKIKKNLIILSKDKFYQDNKKLNKLNLSRNKLVYFDKKSEYFNGGIYYLDKSIISKIKKIKKKSISIEKEIIEKEILRRKIFGVIKDDFFIDIGTEKNLKRGKFLISKVSRKAAIFLDRDGVINYDKGYTHKIKDFKFKPKIIEFLKDKTKKNYYLFIVTNQAGIGHGYFSNKDFMLLQINLKKFLFKNNVLIHDVRYCPFHKDAKIRKYRKLSNYRKPGNLMIENLKKNWNIDIRRSIMIGDKLSDKKCANKSDLKFFYSNESLINLKNSC